MTSRASLAEYQVPDLSETPSEKDSEKESRQPIPTSLAQVVFPGSTSNSPIGIEASASINTKQGSSESERKKKRYSRHKADTATKNVAQEVLETGLTSDKVAEGRKKKQRSKQRESIPGKFETIPENIASSNSSISTSSSESESKSSSGGRPRKGSMLKRFLPNSIPFHGEENTLTTALGEFWDRRVGRSYSEDSDELKHPIYASHSASSSSHRTRSSSQNKTNGINIPSSKSRDSSGGISRGNSPTGSTTEISANRQSKSANASPIGGTPFTSPRGTEPPNLRKAHSLESGIGLPTLKSHQEQIPNVVSSSKAKKIKKELKKEIVLPDELKESEKNTVRTLLAVHYINKHTFSDEITHENFLSSVEDKLNLLKKKLEKFKRQRSNDITNKISEALEKLLKAQSIYDFKKTFETTDALIRQILLDQIFLPEARYLQEYSQKLSELETRYPQFRIHSEAYPIIYDFYMAEIELSDEKALDSDFMKTVKGQLKVLEEASEKFQSSEAISKLYSQIRELCKAKNMFTFGELFNQIEDSFHKEFLELILCEELKFLHKYNKKLNNEFPELKANPIYRIILHEFRVIWVKVDKPPITEFSKCIRAKLAVLKKIIQANYSYLYMDLSVEITRIFSINDMFDFLDQIDKISDHIIKIILKIILKEELNFLENCYSELRKKFPGVERIGKYRILLYNFQNMAVPVPFRNELTMKRDLFDFALANRKQPQEIERFVHEYFIFQIRQLKKCLDASHFDDLLSFIAEVKYRIRDLPDIQDCVNLKKELVKITEDSEAGAFFLAIFPLSEIDLLVNHTGIARYVSYFARIKFLISSLMQCQTERDVNSIDDNAIRKLPNSRIRQLMSFSSRNGARFTRIDLESSKKVAIECREACLRESIQGGKWTVFKEDESGYGLLRTFFEAIFKCHSQIPNKHFVGKLIQNLKEIADRVDDSDVSTSSSDNDITPKLLRDQRSVSPKSEFKKNKSHRKLHLLKIIKSMLYNCDLEKKAFMIKESYVGFFSDNYYGLCKSYFTATIEPMDIVKYFGGEDKFRVEQLYSMNITLKDKELLFAKFILQGDIFFERSDVAESTSQGEFQFQEFGIIDFDFRPAFDALQGRLLSPPEFEFALQKLVLVMNYKVPKVNHKEKEEATEKSHHDPVLVAKIKEMELEIMRQMFQLITFT